MVVRNDPIHVRFGGIRNTKTWSKSTTEMEMSFNFSMSFQKCLSRMVFKLFQAAETLMKGEYC